jgi:hypothetical protein
LRFCAEDIEWSGRNLPERGLLESEQADLWAVSV